MYRENDTIGPYTLRRKLGRGAFGVVWLAEQPTAFGSFEYALKMAARDDIDLKAVAEEVNTWKDAKGPNVLPLITADVYGEDFVIVSEYAPDGSLQAWLDAHGGRAPDLATAVKMTNGILDGLIHLHSKHIIHRDLKPDNILLRGTTPMLADFGLARVLKTTQSSNIAGTVQYMSPEALDNKRTVQVDVWSVGVILYQMLAGRLPFAGQGPPLMMSILRDEPAPLSASVPTGLRDMVACAMQKDTTRRYATAEAMREDLRRFTEQQAAARHRAAQQATEIDLFTEQQAAARRRAAQQATELDLTQRLAAETEARRQAEAERQRQEAARLRAEEERRNQVEAERLRQEEQKREAERLHVAEEERRQAVARRQAERERQAAEAAKRKQEQEARREPQLFATPTPAQPLWPKVAGIGGAVVLSVALLGYALSGSNPTPPKGGGNAPATTAGLTSYTENLPNGIKLEMVAIPAGKFTMGSPESEEDRGSNEGPQHEVSIAAMYLGKYEVTQEQWQAVMGNNPSNFQNCPKCPVENVSWDDAKEFVKKLNILPNKYVYRLPSEAEWEYNARAGTKTAFAFGDSLSSTQANFDGNYPYGGAAKGEYREKTISVGSFQANAFGLHDMHGNVWEWCEDIYQDNYKGLPTDGSPNVSVGDSNFRLLRGGSWYHYALYLRSARRNRCAPANRHGNVGFRVAAAK